MSPSTVSFAEPVELVRRPPARRQTMFCGAIRARLGASGFCTAGSPGAPKSSSLHDMSPEPKHDARSGVGRAIANALISQSAQVGRRRTEASHRSCRTESANRAEEARWIPEDGSAAGALETCRTRSLLFIIPHWQSVPSRRQKKRHEVARQSHCQLPSAGWSQDIHIPGVACRPFLAVKARRHSACHPRGGCREPESRCREARFAEQPRNIED
jgi:hypothetical protein